VEVTEIVHSESEKDFFNSKERFNVNVKDRLLIVYPGKNAPGGVAELYRIASIEAKEVSYFELYGSLRKKIKLVDNILMFFRFWIAAQKSEIVLLNPSLVKKSFFRDGVLILISRVLKKKTIVYWHGWDRKISEKIQRKEIYRWYFQKTFLKANITIVLASMFKKQLEVWGYKKPVFIEKNCASDRHLLSDPLILPRKIHSPVRLLFLARVETQKGIYIALDALRIVNSKSKFPIELVVAGDGIELRRSKDYAAKCNISNVTFSGHVTKNEKHNLLKSSDILIFPSFAEGLPLTLLEAILYGIPIIARPVGGIPDVFENRVHGFLTESFEPKVFADLILELCLDNALYENISSNNIKMSIDFLPQNFRKRMEMIFNAV
jgi:glycosyltransferase involved in cell wall biosynthesis